MKKEDIILAYYAMIAIATCVMILKVLGLPEPKRINCGIAEISPDYSAADRQRCREERLRQASQRHGL